MAPLSRVYVHAAPSIASDIADTLQANDFVRLIDDSSDPAWVKVATQGGKHGWVERSFVDFSRATSSPPDVGPSSTLTPAPTQTDSPQTLSIQLHSRDNSQVSAAGLAQASGELIQNGNFEAGGASWTEVSTGVIIRNDHPGPYQGSWVAWFGGLDAVETLTQLFHVPADVRDAQILTFYIEVATDETGSQVYDTFSLRFFDAIGTPISPSFPIANNTTPTNWTVVSMELNGMAYFAGQYIQIQFVCTVDTSNISSFAIDLVSLTPAPYYVYLPVVLRIPTPTPTTTPIPTATPCASYNPCPSHCTYDCPSDCYSDCYSDCGYVCIYDCTFDCIYDCSYDWYSVNNDDTQ
jgi:hypothetical protein